MGRDHAMSGQEAGFRRGIRRVALWCSPYRGGEERGGEVDVRGQSVLPFLPEEVEARAVTTSEKYSNP